MKDFQEINRILDLFKEREPKLYKSCTPRRYVPPHGYANPRIYAAPLIAAELALLNPGKYHHPDEDKNSSMHIIQLITMRMVEFQMPTYFVNENFLRAVAATKPPEDTRLDQIQWPMEAMLFVLPRAFMRAYCGFEAPFLGIVKGNFGKQRMDLNGKVIESVLKGKDRVLIHTPVFFGQIGTDLCHCSSVDKPISAITSAEEFIAWDEEDNPTISNLTNSPGLETEAQVAKKLNTLALKIWMAIAAKPEYKTEGACLRPARPNSHKEKDELWSPNFIGKDYRIIREPGYIPQGSHASPQMHWRRGHMRNQRFGHQLGQSKLIWIEPVLVNAEPTQEEPKAEQGANPSATDQSGCNATKAIANGS